MPDVYEMDRQRILGPRRGAEILERVQQDAQIKAAIALELEQRAEQQRQAEARAVEERAIVQAEAAAVEKLSPLKPLYQARQAAARQVIEAVSALWRIEAELRAGLNEANRPLLQVEPLIERTQRDAWRESLLTRAGLPVQRIYVPDVQPANEAQAVGVTVVRGLSAGVIQAGVIGKDGGEVHL